jgi:hypothetical protein
MTMNTLKRTQWSDIFFNWRLEVFGEGDTRQAAELFLKLNPACPFEDAEALCLDYATRV